MQSMDRQIYEYLGMLHSSMKKESELQMALINPRVSAEKKYNLMVLASGVDPEATTLYTRFLRLILENHRENQLRIIIFVYRDMYREQYGIDRVVFETAVKVDDDIVNHLTEHIKAHRHRKV